MKTTKACLIILSLIIIGTIAPANLIKAQAQPSVSFNSTTINAPQLNQPFTLNITISNVQNLWGWAVNVTWDPTYLSLTGKGEGDFLTSQVDTTLFVTAPLTLTTLGLQGLKLSDAASSPGDTVDQSASGSGVLATMQFTLIKQTSSTSITLTVENLLGPNPTTALTGTARPIITPISNTATAKIVSITSGPPIANAGENQTVLVGTPVTLDASQSISTGTNTNYTWTFIDGTQQTLTGKTATYTFNNTGTYIVTLTLQDSLGSDNSTMTVTVQNELSTPSPSSMPTATPDITSTPDPPSTSSKNSASFTLPPTILGILIILTVFVLGGSVQWLRKRA